jgi:transposase
MANVLAHRAEACHCYGPTRTVQRIRSTAAHKAANDRDYPGQHAQNAEDQKAQLIGSAERAGKRAVNSSNPTRKHRHALDRSLYRLTHPIENFFNRLKQYSSIAAHHDKTAIHFLRYPSCRCGRVDQLMTRRSDPFEWGYAEAVGTSPPRQLLKIND